MKKTIGFIVILATMAFALFSLKSSLNEYRITVKDEAIKSQILFKGLSGAVDFTKDDEGNYYVAFKDRVQYIDKFGKSYNTIYQQKIKYN